MSEPLSNNSSSDSINSSLSESGQMLIQKALHTIMRHDKLNEAKLLDLKVRSGNKINTINLN